MRWSRDGDMVGNSDACSTDKDKSHIMPRWSDSVNLSYAVYAQYCIALVIVLESTMVSILVVPRMKVGVRVNDGLWKMGAYTMDVDRRKDVDGPLV